MNAPAISRLRRTRCFLLIWLVLPIASFSVAEEAELPRLTFAQRKQLREWIGQYRRSRTSPEQQASFVRQILELGPYGAKELFTVVDKEMRSRVYAYRGKFLKQAMAATRVKTSSLPPAEMTRLQKEVLDLRQVENLSPEIIEATADPVIKKLEAAFLLSREEVLAQSETLQAARQELERPGAIWQQCRDNMKELGDDLPASWEAVLREEEDNSLQLCIHMPKHVRAVFSTNTRLAVKLDAEESRAIRSQNLIRFLLGLEPLAIDLKLCAAARDHSEDMKRLKFFSHTSPVEGKKSTNDRASNFDTSASAENIHAGARRGRQAVDSWFHSPGHFKNMLAANRRIGMGRSGKYFTAMFGR